MGLRSLRSRVEKVERQHRPSGPAIVAELPDGNRYILIGPRISIPPAGLKEGADLVAWHARRPGSWRRLRPGDPIDESRIYRVNTLAVFAKVTPWHGRSPRRPLSIDPGRLSALHRALPGGRSRD